MNNVQLKEAVTQYINAKDNNKPHLIDIVFSQNAQLQMILNTNNISFPANVEGSSAIADTLVRDFNRKFENVYTFCLTDSLQRYEDHYRCGWFVCMNDIETGELKVGFGYYRWFFDTLANESPTFCKLIIEIENMLVFAASHSAQCHRWLDTINYPWCDSQIEIASDISVLVELKRFIAAL